MNARSIVVTAALVVAVAGCTGAPASPAASSAPASGQSQPAASSGASAASSGGSAAAIDNTATVVGWSSSPDENYLTVLMALDAMKTEGYQISGQQLANDDILYQGLSGNTVNIAMGGISQVANAMAAGVPIKIIDTRDANSIVYVANKQFQDCSSLAGKPVGIYSPKAIYTLFMQLYFDQNCPNMKYTPITIADSALRAQALEAGQIDATVLGLPDWLALDAKNPGKYFAVTFGSTLPGIGDEYLIATNQFDTAHPAILDAFVTEHLKAIRSVYGADDATLAALEKKYFPTAKDDTVLKALIKNKVWYANGGLSGEGLQKTLAAFKLPGDPTSMVDTSHVDHAIASIGRSNLTER